MIRSLLTGCIFLIAVTTFSQNYFKPLKKSEVTANLKRIDKNGVISDINDVPNTRVSSDLSVVNPHGILTPDAENRIETILESTLRRQRL